MLILIFKGRFWWFKKFKQIQVNSKKFKNTVQ
jgi:hypothetical protein